jgi:CDP-glucose 4,6-dehydratase
MHPGRYGKTEKSIMSEKSQSTFWRDRPVLVTGATGFIGSWLVKRLCELGADVVCLVRDWIPQSELVRSGHWTRVAILGDATDQALMERTLGEYEIQTVFHLAAQTIVGVANRNPVSTFESNIQGTWVLLEACRRTLTVKQVVVASSDKAYGHQEHLPYSEATPLQGRHPYDVSKSCADLIARAYADTYHLPVCITRCGNFYGGGDLNWNRIVPGTIRSVLRGQAPVIRSDGHYIRDYFYAEDGVAAYLLLAESLSFNQDLAGEAFNFSNEMPIKVVDLAQHILKLMNSDLPLDIRGEATHEIHSQYLDASKARQLLGWAPQFDLDEGLKRSIQWYQEYFSYVSVC